MIERVIILQRSALTGILFRYGYAAVVEILLKRGADPNFKDAEGNTAKDVIGGDLTEDSREIVHTLLREHEEKAKTSRQRRGSCPAIPRTALVMATTANASVSAAAAVAAGMPPSSLPSSDKYQNLPSVGVTHLSAAKPSNRRTSFSMAPHIRVG